MKKFFATAAVAFVALSSGTAARAATAEQRNALHAAKSYLQTAAFSKSSLTEQLEYEHYSESNARWAVNHLRVSWYAEAVKSARSYLQTSSFSREDPIEQLEYEGFTHAQATYGVSKAYH